MSSLIRWEPFSDLISLRDAMDRLFEESFVSPASRLLAPQGLGSLAIDMIERTDDVVVKTSVPGVKPEDIDISITGDTLTIKGETSTEEESSGENFLRRERRYGAFSRSVGLPAGLDPDKAEAVFDNGVLTLSIPKKQEIKPKTIKVKKTPEQ
jgi:HSP20 family protein